MERHGVITPPISDHDSTNLEHGDNTTLGPKNDSIKDTNREEPETYLTSQAILPEFLQGLGLQLGPDWLWYTDERSLNKSIPIGATFSPVSLGGLELRYCDHQKFAAFSDWPVVNSTGKEGSQPASASQSPDNPEAMADAVAENALESHSNPDNKESNPSPSVKRTRRASRGRRARQRRKYIDGQLPSTPAEKQVDSPAADAEELSTPVENSRGRKRALRSEVEGQYHNPTSKHSIARSLTDKVDSGEKKSPIPRRQSKRLRLKDTRKAEIENTPNNAEDDLQNTQAKPSRRTRKKAIPGNTGTPAKEDLEHKRYTEDEATAKPQDPPSSHKPPSDAPGDNAATESGTANPSTPTKSKKASSPTKSPFFRAASSTLTSKERLSSRAFTAIPPLSAKSFGIIQERLAHDPFQLLVAVQFLNKTKGTAAVPVFYELMNQFPTPAALASANHNDVVDIIRHLGLQEQRARRVIALAQTWLTDPPEKSKRHRTLHYPTHEDGMDIKLSEILPDESEDPRTGAFEIAHLPGAGAYALDSWRIFCRDALRGLATSYDGEGAEPDFEPEWKRVVPLDKELRVYLRWKWLREGWFWDPLSGKKERASQEMMHAAKEGKLVWETWDLEGSVHVKDDDAIVKTGKGVAKTGEVWDDVQVAAKDLDAQEQPKKQGVARKRRRTSKKTEQADDSPKVDPRKRKSKASN